MNADTSSCSKQGPVSSPSIAGRVIAFASAKGGTGKTVLAATTALALLRSGKRVLVIDGDFSTRGLSLFILGNILHTSDLVIRKEECLAEFFLSELRVEDIRPRRIDRSGIEYHILFSNESLWQSGLPERAIVSDMRLDPPHYIDGLKRLLAHFRTEYDYIIIDTRGGYDFTSAVPALLSDTYVIVLEPDRVSLEQIQGFDKATKEFADNQKLRIPLRGFVVNKAAFDPNESRFVEELTRTYGIKTYGVIPADLNCIRAYEETESPILRFPYSDFAFWSIRAIEGFIAPELNWTNQEDVGRFLELRQNIGKEWAGGKRTDKILSWLPFVQLMLITFAALLYLIYRRWPSDVTLFAMYTSVAVFITWSMIVSTLSGLWWLRLRDVSAPKRKLAIGAAGIAIVSLVLLMGIDIPRRIFLISLPPQAAAVGESASKGASELEKQALQVTQAWTRLAFDAIDRSEDGVCAAWRVCTRRRRSRLRSRMLFGQRRDLREQSHERPRGELTPTEAAELSSVIETCVKAIEATEIERRLRTLEEQQAPMKNSLLKRRLAWLEAKENISPPKFEFWLDAGDGYLRNKDGMRMTRQAFDAAFPNARKITLNI